AAFAVIRYIHDPSDDSPRNVSIFLTTFQNASWTASSASCWLPVILNARRYARSLYLATSRSAAVGSPRRNASTSPTSRSAPPSARVPTPPVYIEELLVAAMKHLR